MSATPVRVLGIECTDLPPGIEELRIEPSKNSEFGVHVLIKFTHVAEPMSYGVHEFIDLAQKLDGMVLHVVHMAGQYKAEDEILP